MLTPNAIAAHSWQPMSYNPGTGLVYFPVLESWIAYQLDEQFKPEKFRVSIGADMAALPSKKNEKVRAEAATKPVRGHLLAYDPVKQKEAWRVPYSGGGAGGTVTTAGNLVFEGTGDQQFVAYRATDGAKLWAFDAQTVPMAGPMTYPWMASSMLPFRRAARRSGSRKVGRSDQAGACWFSSSVRKGSCRRCLPCPPFRRHLMTSTVRKSRSATGRPRITRRARNVMVGMASARTRSPTCDSWAAGASRVQRHRAEGHPLAERHAELCGYRER